MNTGEFYRLIEKEAKKYNLNIIKGRARLSRYEKTTVPAVILTGLNKETRKKEFSWTKTRIEKRKNIFCVVGGGKKTYFENVQDCVRRAVFLYHDQIRKKFFEDTYYKHTPEPIFDRILSL